MSFKLIPSKSDNCLNKNQISDLNLKQQQHHEKNFTFESHSQQRCRMHSSKDEETLHSDHREQLEKEYKMKIQSIVKSYEVKIAKQQETYQLKQMKNLEEIQYLKRKLKQICIVNKNHKTQSNQQHCSICSNGEVVNFMKNMLEAIQNEHKGCLTERGTLHAKVIALEQKVQLLQKENQQIQAQYTKIKLQIKNYKMDKESLQRQKREKQKQIRDMEREYQVKGMILQQQCSKYKLEQKKLQNELKNVQAKYMQVLNQIRELQQKLKSKPVESIPQPFKQFPKQPYLEEVYKEKFDQKHNHAFAERQQRFGKQNVPFYQYEPEYQSIKNTNEFETNYRRLPKPPVSTQKLRPTQKLRSFFNQSKVRTIQPFKSTVNNMNTINASYSSKQWKEKADQSYADYANSKRKNRKFETIIPPKLSFEESRRSTNTKVGGYNQMKYKYL